MKKLPVAAGTAVVLTAAAVGGLVLFERHERGGLVTQSERACAGREDPAPGAPAALPFELPTTDGETVLRVDAQGSTTVAFAKVDGDRDDVVQVRDDVLRDLEALGYRVVGTDQEAGYEAEAELAGPHEGTIKVSPLCVGLLEVRYALR